MCLVTEVIAKLFPKKTYSKVLGEKVAWLNLGQTKFVDENFSEKTLRSKKPRILPHSCNVGEKPVEKFGEIAKKAIISEKSIKTSTIPKYSWDKRFPYEFSNAPDPPFL